MALSCYIHVPFCARICTYCDFYRIVHDAEWEKRYIDAICAEIKIRFEAMGAARIGLDTLYFGGGTPTVLSSESWEKLMNALNSHCIISAKTEFTTEANPESSTSEKLRVLWKLGANRISFGAQSFDSANLGRLGRLHNEAQIGTAVDTARSVGFRNISVDLMYGLPDETDASFDNDLRRVVALEPQHISMYSLMLEGSVPLRYQVQRNQVSLPSDDSVAARYTRGVEFFGKHGFEHYEISNYAMDGFRCRHNMAYWQHGDYIAFGPAAVGTIGNQRYKNEPDIYRYVKQLAQGKLPVGDLEDVSKGKRLIETIMLSLRLDSGLDYENLNSDFGFDIIKERQELIEALETDGDIIITDTRLRLTTKGMFRADLITTSMLPDFV